MENTIENLTRKIELIHDIKIKVIEYIQEVRGVTVYKVEVDDRVLALKYINKSKILMDIDSDPDYRILTLKREAKILKSILEDFNYYVLDGDDLEFTWLLTNWITGESSRNYVNTLNLNKNDNDRKIQILIALKKIIMRFSNLYSHNILHGDIQPNHIVFNRLNDVDLLDFGLSKCFSDDTFLYKGGLVHFNSPEVAIEMLNKSENIKLDIISEIYSLGSVLFFICTGFTSTNYDSIDYKNIPLDIKLKHIIEGNRNSFETVGASPIDNLEEIINWMLEPDRNKRCQNLSLVLDDPLFKNLY